jgi:polyphosphate kinase 2 (PPK2 family)
MISHSQTLHDNHYVVVKIWLHISDAEQYKRFKARAVRSDEHLHLALHSTRL